MRILISLFLFLMLLTSCSTTKVIYDVELSPSFATGDSDLFYYITKNFNIPKDYGENGAPGHIIVQFVVKEDGNLSNFIVLKSVSKSFDNNFIRMLKKMPKWKPGKKNNINVKTIYILNYFVGK